MFKENNNNNNNNNNININNNIINIEFHGTIKILFNIFINFYYFYSCKCKISRS